MCAHKKKIFDGDTIWIDQIDCDSKHILTENLKLRLIGIDAPEMEQQFGKESKLCLSQLIGKNSIKLKTYGRDRYQRILAKIMVGEVDINLTMIKKGCAWFYRQYQDSLDENDQKLYDQAEQIAQRQFLGLFKNVKALPPWVWRKKN
jgi:micrococcal nuclease